MAANSYYEAHITMVGDPAEIELAVKLLKWKFSKIDGDPTLGDGIKCYATRHYKASKPRENVLMDLRMAGDALEYMLLDSKVIRRKIELVIYDDRSKTVTFNCDGACPECHLDDLPSNSIHDPL